jgi:hypothetical protein
MKEQELTDRFPIHLDRIQSIIDRIHNRYPLVSRYEVVLIVKTFFEITRTLMLKGNYLSINTLYANLHIIQYKRFNFKDIRNIIKTKLTTSGEIKNNELNK